VSLGAAFGEVSDDYARGRPVYPPAAVAAMLAGLPQPPAVVDVGAGSGQLTLPLAAAGANVKAVEPAAAARERLASRVSAIDARAEDLPLADASADLVTCADAFHWFDAERAVPEFHRVLRPGGRLCVAMLRPDWTDAQKAGWADPAWAVVGELFQRSDHPFRDGAVDPAAAVARAGGFGPDEVTEIPFDHRTDPLAYFMSMSVVGVLDVPGRERVRAQVAAVLEREGVTTVSVGFVAVLHAFARS
jgi:SAM-dependent methyltransferase